MSEDKGEDPICILLSGAVSSGDGQADPSVLAVFQDYIKLRPLVAEANQMSEELKKVLYRQPEKQHSIRPRKDLAAFRRAAKTT